MKALPRILRQFRSISRHKAENHGVSLVGRSHFVTRELSYVLQPTHNAPTHPFSPASFTISRPLSVDAVETLNGEGKGDREGPLVEYERRIAIGELMDGELCQLGTLRELQRLYDELVAKANECRLDHYADSEKAGRSRWLWARFLLVGDPTEKYPRV